MPRGAHLTAWKDLELRVCRILGGRRAGPLGAVSDCVGTPWAVECKRSSREGPPVLAAWIKQARLQAEREGRKHRWLLVVAGHRDLRPVVCLDLREFVELAREAGRIPREEEVA